MHGVFGLRITLGRPFPGSLPVVLPTSSPSPLRNSPGFPPGSPRPHRGRTMHVTHVSTCDTQIATRRPPAPCRSRLISPLSQARRARGTLQHVDLGGAAGAVPRTPVAIRFDKTPRATPRGRHHDPRHICHRDERITTSPQTGSPHRAELPNCDFHSHCRCCSMNESTSCSLAATLNPGETQTSLGSHQCEKLCPHRRFMLGVQLYD